MFLNLQAVVSFLFLLNARLASADISTQHTACLTIDECYEQSQVLAIIGITKFSVGNYTSFGCFYEGDTAYFGVGGTIESVSESPLAGGGSRVWCKASSQQLTYAPTGSPSTAELTNTVEPTSSSTVDIFAPTASPSVKSKRPSSKPTNMVLMPTKIRTSQPTKEPSNAPSRRSSSKPTLKPTSQPTKNPSKEPSRTPSPKPTARPTKNPTSQPIPSVSSASGTACRNQNTCNQMRQELGFEKYSVGNYPTKGCFFKGSTAYFGIGGTLAQKSTSLSEGEGKWRIWCGGSTNQLNPTVPLVPASVSPNSEPMPETKYCISIEVNTDKYGQETGFYLTSNGTDPKKLINKAVGSLESETKYSRQVCVPKGKYTFTIEDKFGGLCCSFGRGSYAVRIDGEELVFGGNFQKTVSHDILAGYDPQMSPRDEEWLEAHNTRRQAFHEDHNTEYRPLHWSPELAKDASNWVDEVLPTCTHLREKSLEEGENMAVATHRSLTNNENPDHTLVLWSDNLLKPGNEKGYPDNQTMTQVMWRATRYVGCSDKFIKKADGPGYCYASICRYSRAGNCAVGSGDNWLINVLQDRTQCGTPCPKEGCH